MLYVKKSSQSCAVKFEKNGNVKGNHEDRKVEVSVRDQVPVFKGQICKEVLNTHGEQYPSYAIVKN